MASRKVYADGRVGMTVRAAKLRLLNAEILRSEEFASCLAMAEATIDAIPPSLPQLSQLTGLESKRISADPSMSAALSPEARPAPSSSPRGIKGLLKSAYRRWRERRSGGNGRIRHIRRVDLLATYAARAASPFFSDVLWNGRKHVPSRVSPHAGNPGRILYLTFDDGPHPEGTSKILRSLERFQVPATFFLQGNHVQANPELARDIAEAGHTIGNHSYSHMDAWMHSFAEFSSELDQTTALLEKLLGQPVLWMRPPHGHFTKKIRGWCREHGQKLVMWDLMPADFVAWRNSIDILSSVDNHARPGSIVVLHDSDSALRVTPAALEQMLPRLIDNGWQFAAL